MAIKVGGTTVIDDSRSIANVANVTTTGNVAAANATVTGTITAGSFIGNGAGLTGLSGVTNGKAIAFAMVMGF